MNYCNFEILKGKILVAIENRYDEIVFTTNNDEVYSMYHSQNCCENVSVEDIVGDSDDILNSEILLAEESSEAGENSYSQWTYYKLATIKGDLSIRWYGSSNGYYSVDVTFNRVA